MSMRAITVAGLLVAISTEAGAARRNRLEVSRPGADLVARGLDASEHVAVVQLDAGAGEALQDAIPATGAELLAYLGDDAWLVRASDAELARLRALPHARAAGDLSRERRLSRPLAAMLAAAPADEVTYLRVDLLPGADANAWHALLEATPGGSLLSLAPDGLRPQALLKVSSGSLHAAAAHLSGLRDVLVIEPVEQRLPHLDEASWWLQTGRENPGAADYDVSAKLFRKGLTGRGILVAHADDGLENDACELLYASGIDEAAWPIGPSADQPVAVPLEMPLVPGQPAPMRSRDRKVVAYYVQSGAVAYSSPAQHGTSCAEAALGDDMTVLAARPLVRDLGRDQNVSPWRPDGTWLMGDSLRPDVASRVDFAGFDDPRFPNDFGALVEHHQSGDGIAPGAQLVFQDLGDAVGDLSFLTTIFSLASQASLTGASVHLMPFGGGPCQDCYLADSRDIDAAAWMFRDYVPVISAGNEGALGPGSIAGGAAQAKSPIVVGATERASDPTCDDPGSCPLWSTTRSGEDMSWFSAQGPTSGTIQPLLVAPGVVGSRVPDPWPPTPEDGSGSGDEDCGLPSGSRRIGGTSLSASVTAGMVALIQQYFLDGYYPTGRATPANALRPTNALVTAVLVNSARDLLGARTAPGGGQAHRPNNVQGWGAPRLDDTLYFAGDPEPGPISDRTERASLLVWTDTPNGFDSSNTLAPEPGGQTRDQIVAAFHTALQTNGLHEFFVNLDTDRDGDGMPELDDPANEWRITLAWRDFPGTSAADPNVNDLDLEVVSPGPDGILQTAGGNVLGDDVVYRPSPSIGWRDGYTVPSRDAEITVPPFNGLNDWPDRDPLNTVENVFVRSQDVVSGTWIVRVLGHRVPAAGATNEATPNFALLDQAPTRDTDGDTVPDIDERDTIIASKQGYALIASGPVARPPVPVRYVPGAPPVFPPPPPPPRPPPPRPHGP